MTMMTPSVRFMAELVPLCEYTCPCRLCCLSKKCSQISAYLDGGTECCEDDVHLSKRSAHASCPF